MKTDSNTVTEDNNKQNIKTIKTTLVKNTLPNKVVNIKHQKWIKVDNYFHAGQGEL